MKNLFSSLGYHEPLCQLPWISWDLLTCCHEFVLTIKLEDMNLANLHQRLHALYKSQQAVQWTAVASFSSVSHSIDGSQNGKKDIPQQTDSKAKMRWKTLMTASLPTPLGPLITSTRGLGDGTCGWLSNGDPNACSNSSSIGTYIHMSNVNPSGWTKHTNPLKTHDLFLKFKEHVLPGNTDLFKVNCFVWK